MTDLSHCCLRQDVEHVLSFDTIVDERLREVRELSASSLDERAQSLADDSRVVSDQTGHVVKTSDRSDN